MTWTIYLLFQLSEMCQHIRRLNLTHEPHQNMTRQLCIIVYITVFVQCEWELHQNRSRNVNVLAISSASLATCKKDLDFSHCITFQPSMFTVKIYEHIISLYTKRKRGLRFEKRQKFYKKALPCSKFVFLVTNRFNEFLLWNVICSQNRFKRVCCVCLKYAG